jgi:hypothetical protein
MPVTEARHREPPCASQHGNLTCSTHVYVDMNFPGESAWEENE